MVTKLNDFLSSHEQKGFKAVPHYYASGDYLTFYVREARCFAHRVDDVLTVYRSMDDHEEFIGCKIKGLQNILKTAKSFGIKLDGGGFTLGFLFLVGMSMAKDENQRMLYYEIKDIVKDVSIDDLHQLA